MKRCLFIFISVIFSCITNAQIVFCPPGAEWHYNFHGYANSTIYNEKITYAGDTLVAGDNARTLKHRFSFNRLNDESGNPIKTCIKQKGDTVFLRNKYTQHAWQVLYNFNVVAGNSWQNVMHGKTFTVTVDSVGYVVVNAMSLKVLYVYYCYIPHRVKITERFGCNGFMFNFIGGDVSDGAYLMDFLCYSDSAFGTKQFTAKPCNFTDYTGIEQAQQFINDLRFFPNPVHNILNVKMETSVPEINFSLANLIGQKIQVNDFQKNERDFELNLENLENGVYFLQVFSKGKLIAVQQVVKE